VNLAGRIRKIEKAVESLTAPQALADPRSVVRRTQKTGHVLDDALRHRDVQPFQPPEGVTAIVALNFLMEHRIQVGSNCPELKRDESERTEALLVSVWARRNTM
jgi:hypothetical protein